MMLVTHVVCSVSLITIFVLPQQDSVAGICIDGDMKLENGEREYEGRIELCYRGEWGSVCDESTNDRTAEVVCTQLQLPLHNPKIVMQFGGGKGPVHLHTVQCNGNEDNLLQCNHIKTEDNKHAYCVHFDDLGVSCAPPCSEGEVRLLRDRVQTCHNQVWGYVCYEHGWSRLDARVVCRELGLPYEDALVDYEHFYQQHTFPYFLNYTNCNGSELHLIDCHHINQSLPCGIRKAAKALCSDNEACYSPYHLRIRSFGNKGNNFGRLEMCYDGYWGSVCSDYAFDPTARIACKDLGYTDAIRAELSTLADYDVILPNVPIVLDDVTCTGFESSLLECPHAPYTVHSCVQDEDIVLECREKECNGTDIRLVDGRTALDGRVEICQDELWISVCANKWDYREATVVCRQLGYSESAYALLEYGILKESGAVSCYGNETMLQSCFQTDSSAEGCVAGESRVTVICTGTTCEEDDIRLVGGYSVKEGRVQVCYNGTWHSVCADRWSDKETSVVCSTLGYPSSAVSLVADFGGDASLLPRRDIQCNGSEVILGNCTNTECNSKRVAGVICEAPCHPTVCNECNDLYDCHPVSDSMCSCTSECFFEGKCCPNVDYLLNCFDPVDCMTGDIRLVGGVANSSSGILEVCVNGVWGTVCDYSNEWDHENAAVVCHQLKLPTSAAIPLPFSYFGSASNHLVLFDSVQCTGSEEMILECSHSTIGNHFCSQFSKDSTSSVAIQCQPDCHEGDVRLMDGTDPSNGRVEICQRGIWGSICYDNKWDVSDARVVCRQLNYTLEDDVDITGVFGGGGSVLMSNVECHGSEEGLYLCPRSTIDNYTCHKNIKMAGVICSKEFYSSMRCKDQKGTPPSNKYALATMKRFGVCEPYFGMIEHCNEVFRTGIDYVYISTSLGTQQNVSMLLQSEYLASTFHADSMFCYDTILKVICKYYLSPCGTESLQVFPHSICADECSNIERDCPKVWKSANSLLEHFITCNYTSDLIFPLPSCCEGLSPTTQESGDSSSDAGSIVGGLLTALLILSFIVTVILFYFSFKHKRKQKRIEKFQRDIFTEDSSAMEMSSEMTTTIEQNAYTERQQPAVSHSLMAVDERISRSRPNSCYLRELTHGKFVIKYKSLSQFENIGQGEFGIVYRAKLGSMGTHIKEVAVKTLKGNFNQTEVDEFLEESLKMSRFKHTHVMGLIGVCLDAGSAPYIVMPYMANGSLLDYLRKERSKLVVKQENDDEVEEIQKRLMVMCSQIASGMEYLAAEKYIHRDLAARNCMIDSHFLIKITDFGLSEDVFLRNYYREGVDGEMAKLPFKWMAPESLSDGHFSEKSDVWSYGVTMWEIFSGGKSPYPGTDPVGLVQMLDRGERMPEPYNAACNEEIYMMMLQCWEAMPDKRPCFKELYSKTSKYIERIAGYLEIGFNPFAGQNLIATGLGESDSAAEVHDKGEVDEEVISKISVQVTPASP